MTNEEIIKRVKMLLGFGLSSTEIHQKLVVESGIPEDTAYACYVAAKLWR